MWAANLPWLSLLELWEEGTASGFVILYKPHASGGNIGWYIECSDLGIKVSEECATPEVAAEASNIAEGLNVTFSDTFTELMGLKLTLCSGNKEEAGVATGLVITVSSLGGSLTVSE